MKTPWSKNNFARLMNEAGDGAGGGGNAGVPIVEAPVVETPVVDKTAAGYKETENQAAAGYKEHKEPEKKEYKFDKEGHDEGSLSLVESYAEANELSEKQVEGFANFIKSLKSKSDEARNQSAEALKAQQFNKMQADYKSLKEDPDFGKDIEVSFMQMGKVLDLMPDLKKQLTVDGKHIDPVVARSLKSLYGKLYGQDGVIVQGGTSGSEDTRPDHDKIYGKYDKK